MKPPFGKLAYAWSITAIVLVSSLTGCAKGNIDDEAYREELKRDITNALSNNDCIMAVALSNELYTSKYSDNEIRMLYASSQACVTGVRFYNTLEDIKTNDFSSLSAIFRSLVKIFPSRTALDSRLQAAWYAQDALQAMWNTGAIVAPADLFYGTSINPGSSKVLDRTLESNVFLILVSMGGIGTGLNRYGFNPTDDPSATSYVKTIPLPWTTTPLVLADKSGAACGIASALFNLVDSGDTASAILPSSIASNMASIVSTLGSAMYTAAKNYCTTDVFPATPYTALQCDEAILRLRFRGACTEQNPAASSAAGIINAINAGWI